MQVSARSLTNVPIIGFSTNEKLGLIQSVIIDPAKMKVLFLTVHATNSKTHAFLPASEIREITHRHCIIDSQTSLTTSEDLVRHERLIVDPVLLLRYKVVTHSSHSLGRCYDFVFDSHTMALTKIYVQATHWQRIFINHHIIDVSDVLRIKTKQHVIVVRDALLTELKEAKNVLPAQTS